MKLKAKHCLLSLTLIFLFGGCIAVAEGPVPGQPTPEQQAMMKKMQEAGQPAPQHQELQKMVGTWKANSLWRMSPEQPAEKSTAVVERKPILNGLFVKEHYQDKNAKHPFEGIGVLGYDKVAGFYSYTWMDTMTTSTWSSKGEKNQKNNTITFKGSGYCPMTGGMKKTHSELEFVNNDKQIFRMYDVAPNGKKFKNLEIVYTRSS